MSTRESDTATTCVAIAAIAVIICACLACHVDETLVKLGLVAIAGIAGFTFHGIIKRQ
jgi:uncharacterized membrane protein required for colicin V production